MLVSAAWIGPAVFGALNAMMQPRLWGDQPASLASVLFTSLDWFIYAALTPGVFAASERWPLARPHLVRHAVVHLLVSLLFCAAWAAGGTLLRVILEPQALSSGVWINFASWLFTTFPFGISVYLAVVGIEHAIRYFDEARDRELQVARLSEQLSGARFAALQAQLNPHFLFNTLNTIAVLVRGNDRARAVRIVEQLSDVLRRTLSRHRANEVRLGEELELVRQYLAIEQSRFSDRLQPVFEIDANAAMAAVPSFAVQHLVENAIRHGIARHPDAERVTVRARRVLDQLEVSVADDGAGVDEGAAWPRGHGLDNTRERLRSLYADRASLTVAALPTRGTIATLRVPYREMPTEVADDQR
jgi:two-component sensor histidine kinase